MTTKQSDANNEKINEKFITAKYQPSLTEWFNIIGDSVDAKKIQDEDNNKHARLELLQKIIRLPYLKPKKVRAIDLYNKTPKISKIFEKQGNDLCAIRLIPQKTGLPKLRNRGLSLENCYAQWFLRQDIDFKNYEAEICPHSEIALYSIVLVVDERGIFGEIVPGHSFQIIHGDAESKTYKFFYDFSKWKWSEKNPEIEKYVKRAVVHLRIKKAVQEEALEKELQAKIFKNYLGGYFEVVVWGNKKGYFFDYNRLMPDYIAAPKLAENDSDEENIELKGLSVFPGVVVGKVAKISPDNISKIKFENGSILVTDNTDVRFLPIMRNAGAILTERGSILSHASIIARELKKPCIVGINNLTKILKNDDLIKVDANNGAVVFIKHE